LAAVYAAADVFVFPSKTDTFGLVLLEALASGVPVAAFPVAGPRDLIGGSAVGALDRDLRAACLARAGVMAFVRNFRALASQLISRAKARQSARDIVSAWW